MPLFYVLSFLRFLSSPSPSIFLKQEAFGTIWHSASKTHRKFDVRIQRSGDIQLEVATGPEFYDIVVFHICP